MQTIVRTLLIDLLMAFSELEKRKHEKFPEKQYAGARVSIEQKTLWSLLDFPFNCSITPSNYKHDVYTVLIALKSG